MTSKRGIREMESVQRNQNKRAPRPLACIECRKSKRKCDGKEPSCSECVKKEKKCVYELTSKRKPATHRYTEALKERIKSLENVLSHYTKLYGVRNPSLFEESQYDAYPNLSALNFGLNIPAPNLDQEKREYNSHRNSKLHVNTTYWALNIKDNKIFFEGPTSSRYISSANYIGADNLQMNTSVDEFDAFHKEVFKWYFGSMNKTVPLVDEDLFLASLRESLENRKMGKFASKALVNAIVTAYYLSSPQEFGEFRELTIKQVNQETLEGPEITTVQTLVLLAALEMANGNESSSSDFMARAVASCYHLGLHVSSEMLVNTGKVSAREARMRDMVFWCCFMVDRLRCTVLGMHPFMYCTHISIKLPRTHPHDPNLEMIEVFRDTLCFTDLQFRLLQDHYSVEFSLPSHTQDVGKANWIKMHRHLHLTKGEQIVEEWRKNISSFSRYQSHKSVYSAHLQAFVMFYKILMNKPLLKHPIQRHSLGISDSTPISVCTQGAIEVIQICSDYELNSSLLLYQFLYGLYLSAIICLFNCTSSNKEARAENKSHFLQALALFEKYLKYAKIAITYHSNLKIFEKQWKFPQAPNDTLATEEENISASFSEKLPSDEQNCSADSGSTDSATAEENQPLDSSTGSPRNAENFYDPSWIDFSSYIFSFLPNDVGPSANGPSFE